MDKYQQKEFIKGLLNYKSNIEDPKMKAAIEKIQSDISSEVSKNLYNINSSQNEITYEQMEALCKENNIEPIDMIDNVVDVLSAFQTFSYDGFKVDFSKTKDFMNLAKQKFKEHKESEDINNF
jgi:hypothetical protein